MGGEASLPQNSESSMSALSPELALVDPELRALAIACLPQVRPYEFLEPPRIAAVVPLRVVVAEPPRVTAAAAYLALALVRAVVFNAALFLAVTAVVLFLNLV